MTDEFMMNAWELIGKVLEEEGDVLRELLTLFVNRLMSVEADAVCGASYRARSEGRINRRNGYRSRRFDTRVGTLTLAIPKLRKGSYYPDWLLQWRRRSERALVAVVAECYVRGVSTRRVDGLVAQLGIDGLSKSQVSDMARELDKIVDEFRNRPLEGPYPYLWLDALAVKCRDGGRVVNVAVVVATAVNAQGHRETLGLDVFTTEDGAAWTQFLRGLVARGPKGVKLVITDAHEGLKQALAATLPGATWQRCRTHFLRNLYAKVPKSTQRLVGTLVRTIFDQGDAEKVRDQYAPVVEQLRARLPQAADAREDAKEDLPAFTAFPREHWRRIWSNNPQERLNKELRRRSDVVGIFPNRAAIIRLLGAVLAEQHDEWAVSRRHLPVSSLAPVLSDAQPQQPPPALTEAAA